MYAARPLDSHHDKPWDFALKIAKHQSLESRKLLQREALVGQSQSHPNVISVFAAQTDRLPMYLVTPFLDGAPLMRVTRLGLRVPPQHALWIVRQIAQGLQSLHEAGWRHGDVKPDNIIVGASGHATLIDLGFCQRIEPRMSDSPNALAMSWAYAAPELFSMSQPILGAADLYSLGVVLYELLTAQLPYQGTTAADLARQHLSAGVPNPRTIDPSLPVEVDWLLRRLLAKDPLRRPSDEELVDRLSSLEIELLSCCDLAVGLVSVSERG